MSPAVAGRPVRIANCSGFFGDRLSAAKEMVEGTSETHGGIDVLTGDWLAELTMLILHKQRLRNPEAGYAGTFLLQMQQVLATCAAKGIKVVANAGGLNPAGCAEKVRLIAEALGVDSAALVQAIAYHDDPAILDGLANDLPKSREELGDLYAKCRAQAYQQLVAEIGDPTPHRLG